MPAKPAAKKKPAAKPAPKPRAPAATVLAAVKRDLAAIAKVDKDLATGALAASAQALARELDNKDNPPAAKASCARALADTMAHLRQMTPRSAERDRVDELSERRSKRLAGRAAT